MRYVWLCLFVLLGTVASMGQGMNPSPPRLPVGCTTADANCIPLRTGDQPYNLKFQLPYSFNDSDCGGPTSHNMPGTSYTYPTAGGVNHVWCPATYLDIRNLLAGQTIGGSTLLPGDIIALDKESVNPQYLFSGAVSSPCINFPAKHYFNLGYETGCDIQIPPMNNPLHKITYMISRGYAALPASGTRIHPSTDSPNMAKLALVTFNTELQFAPYANNWRFVGIEITSAIQNTIGAPWARGFAYKLMWSPGGARFGRRDLHATTGSKVDWLGQALEMSITPGVLISFSPNTVASSTTTNIVITTQMSHACDNVTVTCASVNSDSPTAVTFGFGVTTNSVAVANVTCPTGFSGTCQTITANITTSATPLMPRNFVGSNTPNAALASRTPMIITHRSAAGYLDEYMYATNSFFIHDPTGPYLSALTNTTQGGKNVFPLNGACQSGCTTQALKIIGVNTSFTTNGSLGWQNVPIGPNGPNLSAVTVISDTEIDLNAVFGSSNYREIGPITAIVIPGTTGTPVPITSISGPLMYVVPQGTEASWITSTSCPRVSAGQTYTCDVYGANTNWVSGSTTFDFDYQPMPNGSNDISTPTVTILSPTHAQITFTVDASAPAGADHILFDRCFIHGIFPNFVYNSATQLTEPDSASWGKAQLLGDIYTDEGNYMAIMDSELCCADYLTWPGINEGHGLSNLAGSGPRYIRNTYFHDMPIQSFVGGGKIIFGSPNLQPADMVYIRNLFEYTPGLSSAGYPQYTQPAQNSQTAVTNLTTTIDGSGHVTGVTGTQPTGFMECPNYGGLSGGGGSGASLNCSIVNGQLSYTVKSAGSGYTSSPYLTTEWFLFGSKNHLEHKNARRVLVYGNYFGWNIGNSLLNQAGNAMLLSSKAGTQGNLFNTVEDVTIESNWMDQESQALSTYTITDDCYSNTNAPGEIINPEDCGTPFDPRGSQAYPNSSTKGYNDAHPGANTRNVLMHNNLITGHGYKDLSAYHVGPPSATITGELTNKQSNLETNGMVGFYMSHNTFWRYWGATSAWAGLYFDQGGWSASPTASNTFYNGTPPFSVNWDQAVLDNVMWCQPTGQSGTFGKSVAQNIQACPTAGENCPVATGDYITPSSHIMKWEQRLYGNLIYNGPGCLTPNTVDWTYGGTMTPATNLVTSSIPTFAGASSYVTRVTPGDWTLVSPQPPATNDGGTPGVNMVALNNALGCSNGTCSVITGTGGTGNGLTLSGTFVTGAVNEAYSGTLTVSGGTSPYTYSITSGSLPPGLTLTSTTGKIAGTPTTAGTSAFTALGTDSASNTASAGFSITINPALAVVTTSLPSGQVGRAYNQSLQATGGLGTYTWSLQSGTMCAGLTLATNGSITGTPTTVQGCSFTAQVVDTGGAIATQALSIVIAGQLVVTTPALPSGTVGKPYSQNETATGGTPPYSWVIYTGSLCSGLNLSSGGTIAGTPDTIQTCSFSVQVSDAAGNSATAPQSIGINAAIAPLTVTSTSCPTGIISLPYICNMTATGGVPPYTWSIASGNLPPVLTINGNVITGSPIAIGVFTFVPQVTDSASSQALGSSTTITINPLAGQQTGRNTGIGKNVVVK